MNGAVIVKTVAKGWCQTADTLTTSAPSEVTLYFPSLKIKTNITTQILAYCDLPVC